MCFSRQNNIQIEKGQIPIKVNIVVIYSLVADVYCQLSSVHFANCSNTFKFSESLKLLTNYMQNLFN